MPREGIFRGGNESTDRDRKKQRNYVPFQSSCQFRRCKFRSAKRRLNSRGLISPDKQLAIAEPSSYSRSF